MDDKTNILKQAKYDIFNALEGIIKFYILKGASYKALKKYYKKKKNFDGLLDDIKNKGVNFFEKENEYKTFVKKILTEFFEDRIAHEKDNPKVTESKNLKNFNDFISKEKIEK